MVFVVCLGLLVGNFCLCLLLLVVLYSYVGLLVVVRLCLVVLFCWVGLFYVIISYSVWCFAAFLYCSLCLFAWQTLCLLFGCCLVGGLVAYCV